MKPTRLISTILAMMLCLSVLKGQILSQQPASPSSETAGSVGAINTINAQNFLALSWRGRPQGILCLPANAQETSPQSAWTVTGPLNTERFGHTATLLANGKVLAVGGRTCAVNSCTEFSSAELFDPGTNAWSAAGDTSVPRHGHIAVLLPSGKVLVAGGFDGAITSSTSELYDPNTGSWSATGNLSSARAFATATLLPNGKVLVSGGGADNFLSSTELYDPATGAWSPAGAMNVARGFHTATMLTDGKVLVAGGAGGSFTNPIVHPSAEIYDPATETCTLTGGLGTARVFHTSNVLQNGKVLVTGGSNFVSTIYETAELYDPATGQWSATGMLTTPRNSHTATLLATGKVLAVAGFNNEPVNSTHGTTELYDPDTESWSAAASLNVVRGNHAATLLADGRVLVSGGNGGGLPALSSTEMFAADTTPPTITLATINGKTLFVEGHNFDQGAKVYLNGEKQKTTNDEANPGGLLRCKKAGKRIQRGATVILKVRNSDGTESVEFSYTRPEQ